MHNNLYCNCAIITDVRLMWDAQWKFKLGLNPNVKNKNYLP